MKNHEEKLWKIPSTTPEDECFTIYELARILPNDSQVVEIGTGAGRVTIILALALAGKGSLLHTVDNYSENRKYGVYGNWNLDTAKEYAKEFNVDGHIKFISSSSVQYAKTFGNCPIDMLFLDGSHRYADVCKEIDAWVPLVKDNGIIAGHDFDPNCNDGRNVIKAVFDKLMLNPDKQMQVEGRVWWMKK